MRGPRSQRLGLFGFVLAAVVFVAPASAFAHASLANSTPANGASGPAPASVTLTFTKTFAVVAPGIQLLDANGKPVSTNLVVRDKVATLTPKSPLSPGAYGVRWTVKAPDSHPRSGSFTFTVVGAVTATAPVPAAGAPTTTTATTTPAASVAPEPVVEGSALAVALTQPASWPYDLIGGIGRFVLYAGSVFIIGALALGFFVARASAREAQWLVMIARRAALLVGLGTILTVFGQVGLFAGPGIPWPWKVSAWTHALGSMWGLSVACMLGATVAFVRAPGPRFARVDTWLDAPVTVGAPAIADEPPADAFVTGRLDWRSAYPMFAALAALLLGLAWNGHSQSSSPLFIAWLADIAHVLAAGAWGGGIVLLIALIARRRRANNPALTADAALRFSTVATIASVGAGATGLVLAAVELPSFGALFTSAFGLLLLAKVAVVAAVATAGAYNHFRVLPGLQADPSAAQTAATWKLLRLEALGIIAVLVLTTFLANASYS